MATEFAISAFGSHATTCGQATSTNDAARSIYVTCGSIVYCVEDADHPWEERHFKVKHEISQESMQ